MHAYPDDYAVHDVFGRFTPYLKKGSLLAVHRNDSLFYHIWYRKTSEGYFGLCVLLNGLWFSRTDILMGVFESAFSLAAVDGKVLRVGNDGHIRTIASAFAQNKSDINKIDLYIKESISSYSRFCVGVPPQNASIEPNAIHSLQDGAFPQLFGNALETYRSVYATYGIGDGNVNALLRHIEDIALERDDFGKKCIQLEEQCRSIEKSKNRYATVVLLTCLMLIGSVVAIGVIVSKNSEIRNKEIAINHQRITVEEYEGMLAIKSGEMEFLMEEVDSMNSRITRLMSDKKNILNHTPFIITSTEYNDREGLLTVSYFAPYYKEGSTELKVLVTCEDINREVACKHHNLRKIRAGYGNFRVKGINGLNPIQLHRFEVYADGHFVGGGRH